MLSIDINFLLLCTLVEKGRWPEPKEEKKYFEHGGFINFYNGNCKYAVKDCSAIRKYLESRGYSKGSSEVWVQGYDSRQMDEYLKSEGPYSYNYRRIMSYSKNKIWEKLDELQSAMGMSQAIDFLIKNNIYLSPYTEEKFLRSPEGKYSVLRYALLNGKDYFGKISKILMEEGLYNPGKDSLTEDLEFLKGLSELPYYPLFDDILKEVASQKKSRK